MAYSDEQKASALAVLTANGHSFERTAQAIGIPARTLRHWAAGEFVNASAAKNADIKKGEIADRLESAVHALIDILPQKTSEATLQQVMTGIGIAVDKMLLLRDKATTITKNPFQGISEEERLTRINEILDRARERRRLNLIEVGASEESSA